MPNQDSEHDSERKGPARIRVNGLVDVVSDRLLAREQGPRFENQEEEDDAEQCCHHGRHEHPGTPHDSSFGAFKRAMPWLCLDATKLGTWLPPGQLHDRDLGPLART